MPVYGDGVILKPDFSTYVESISSLKAYYPLDETSGTVINRAPSTFGSLNGTASNVTQGQSGKFGLSASFNGTTSIITVSDNDALDLTSKMAIGAIIAPTGLGGGSLGRIVDKNPGASGYALSMNATARFQLITAGTSIVSNNSVFALDGTFYLAIANYDSTLGSNQFSFNVNGSSAGSTTNAATTTANTTAFTIGNRGDLARGFVGKIQHVMLFNDTLSSTQMTEMARLAGF